MNKFVGEYNFSEKLNNSEAEKYCNEKASEFSEHLSSNTHIIHIIVRVQPYSNTLENRLTPLRGIRWLLAFSYLGLFLYNVIISQGFYALAYLEGIYLLTLFNTYIPQFKPEAEVKDLESQTDAEEDEFNTAFESELNEYNIWKRTMISTLICQLLTNVRFLDFPVFWPILVGYLIYATLASVLKRVKCPALVNKIILRTFAIIDSLLIFCIFGFLGFGFYTLFTAFIQGGVNIY